MIGKVNDPELAALKLLDNLVAREAFIIAINNIYTIIAILFCIGAVLIPFSSMPENTEGSNAH